MIGQQDRIDAISNDLANVNTTGYKQQRYSFQDLLYQQAGNNRASEPQSRNGAGVRGSVIGRNFDQGSFTRTDRKLDLAINGEGFFRVRQADGQVALTRDGNFRIDGDRQLTTSTGQRLIPGVRIPNGVNEEDITVTADGTVRGRAGTAPFGRIDLVTVASPDHLRSIGGSNFVATAESGTTRPAGGTITQGALEDSNADTAQAMTDLIEAQRAYDLSSRAVRTWDDMLSTANQIRR